MTARRLGILLLAVVVGVGLGALTAYATQPRTQQAGLASPVPAESPSIPVDVKKAPHYASDIDYPTLPKDLRLNVVHTVKNDLATWEYHVPEGWTPYAACLPPPNPCKIPTDTVLPPKKVDKQQQVRFRPAGEPTEGGYSLRVRILDNTMGTNLGQMVASKEEGFRQEFSNQFRVIKQTDSAVYFSYVDSGNHLRLNFFQWFAAPGSEVATLEMSVAGRKQDQPGLDALLDRFADNVTATG